MCIKRVHNEECDYEFAKTLDLPMEQLFEIEIFIVDPIFKKFVRNIFTILYFKYFLAYFDKKILIRLKVF